MPTLAVVEEEPTRAEQLAAAGLTVKAALSPRVQLRVTVLLAVCVVVCALADAPFNLVGVVAVVLLGLDLASRK